MPKALCMSGMVVAILILILFLFDLVAPATIAPFRKASILMDVAMLVCALLLGLASWLTFREQS
ncbi:MAG: hypothetical protein SFU86_09725 [Pirellulaceae bacterium]|nr:hypothetical protein [Pirellulaceae bacterium]